MSTRSFLIAAMNDLVANTKNMPKVTDLVQFSNGSFGMVLHSRILRYAGLIVIVWAFGKFIRLDMSSTWYWNEDGFWYEKKF